MEEIKQGISDIQKNLEKTPSTGKKNEMQKSDWIECNLCTADQLPVWHFKHRRLYNGYRTPSNVASALYSLFYFHNESFNIWAHYIGTALLIYKALDRLEIPLLWTQLLPYMTDFNALSTAIMSNQETFEKVLLFGALCLGNVFPILASALCHHFYFVNKSLHKACWFLDFMGMSSGIFCVGMSFVIIALECHPMLVKSIVTALLVGYISAIVFCWQMYSARMSKEVLEPYDRFPEFSKVLTSFSVYSYSIALAGSIWMEPAYLQDPTLWNVFVQSCLFPACMGGGIVVFAQGGIPERFVQSWGLPEHFFDYFGHSHQVWHMVSFLLLYHWIDVILGHYHVRKDMLCPLNPQ